MPKAKRDTLKMFKRGMTIQSIADMYGVSRQTVYTDLREYWKEKARLSRPSKKKAK